jgi:signal transduction histidine kinase/ligand-binding sensor domain-containing protein
LYPLDAPPTDGALVFTLAAGENGRVWVGGSAGLFSFDPGTGVYSRWPGEPALARAIVRQVLPDGDRGLWVASRDGLYRLDLAAARSTHYAPRAGDPTSLSVASLSTLARDRQGRLWIGTQNGGLDCLEPDRGIFRHHRPDIEDERSLGSGSVASLHVDDQDIVWIGTYDVGLNFVSPFEQAFHHLKAQADGLSSSRVGAVMEGRAGDLWIGTNGAGLDRKDARTGRYTHYRHRPEDPQTIASNAIFALLEAADGTIWVGGWGAGLGRLDPRSGNVRRYRHDARDPRSLPNDNVWKVLELASGELLVATQGGVFAFDRKAERFARLSDPKAAGANDWYGAAEDAQGNAWIGGVGGAQHVDRAAGRVRSYVSDPKNPQGLGPGWVMAVHVDTRGDVWFGTESGLNHLEIATGSWRRFTVADGLGHDTVMGVLEGPPGTLWLSTIRGITRVEDAAGPKPRFSNFEARDGLTNTYFTRGAASPGPSGRLYFGGGRGLSYFSPEDVRANPTPPTVVFTGLRIQNEPVRPGTPGSPLREDITETRALTLSHRATTVTFEFAALSFVLPHKNRFAYRLEGLEDSWNEVGAQRFATYTSLPEGRYTLRVKAANNDGVWSEGTSLDLTVLPPFYRALWFRLAALLAVAAGLAVAHRRRTARMRARAHELEAKVDERTRELNREIAERVRLNQDLERRAEEVSAAHAEALGANTELEAFAYSVSHDLRAPLRAIDGFSRILAAEAGPGLDEEARRLLGLVRGSAQRMGRLIDDLLAFSRLGRQGLKSENVDMDKLVRAAWSELPSDLPIRAELSLDPLPPAWCDPSMVRQVLANLLSNAVKFSAPVGQPAIKVGGLVHADHHAYYVRDNGVGFDARYAHKLFAVFQRLHSAEEFDGTGVGLAIVERIVRRHGGRVWAEGQEGKGATFHFSLPRSTPSADGP